MGNRKRLSTKNFQDFNFSVLIPQRCRRPWRQRHWKIPHHHWNPLFLYLKQIFKIFLFFFIYIFFFNNCNISLSPCSRKEGEILLTLQTKTDCTRLCLYPQEYKILIQEVGSNPNNVLWHIFALVIFSRPSDKRGQRSNDNVCLDCTWVCDCNHRPGGDQPADAKYKLEEFGISPDLGSFFLCFGILRLFWTVEYLTRISLTGL